MPGAYRAARLLGPALLGLLLAACGPAGSPVPSTPGTGATNAGPAEAGGSASPAVQAQVSIAGKLAFSRDGNIWVYEGSAAKQVTNVGSAADPAWSPDGKTLAFDTQAKNSADLYVMPYPGGQPRALTRNTSSVVEQNLWAMQPDWSPDGQTLAFISDRGRAQTGTLDPAVWRMSATGTAISQVSKTNAYTGGVDFPRWRPAHAGEIAYTSWQYDPTTLLPFGQLVLLNTRTGVGDGLTPPTQTGMQPAWSPDGNFLAYLLRGNNGDELRIMSFETATPSASGSIAPSASAGTAEQGPASIAVASGLQASHPVWSPDGKDIAYVALKNGSFDLFVQPLTAAHLADGQPKQLTSGWHLESASAIAWSA